MKRTHRRRTYLLNDSFQGKHIFIFFVLAICGGIIFSAVFSFLSSDTLAVIYRNDSLKLGQTPEVLLDKVAEGLEPGGRLVTKYGPATENPESPLYLECGYWRGPIWGPEVVIICDGLARGGYKKQAKEIAKRYCNMCWKTNIFAENYDPLSGEPLCDRAYTWGSSAFLVLAHELLR